MEKTELIEALEDGREELLEMIEDLPDETLLEPGVMGDWSIKDILAHLAQWEGQTVTLLFQARRGIEQPSTVHFSEETTDAINARWYEQSKSRSLAMVMNDFRAVRKQTIRRINEFSKEELNDPNHFAWLKGVPLAELILSDTVEHEDEHADYIRDWLDQRDSKNNGKGPHQGGK